MKLQLLAGMLLPIPLVAQTPPPTPRPVRAPEVVRVGVDLVQVNAIVTNGKGEPVADLKTEDFDLFEDGKRQTITHCRYVKVGASAEVVDTSAGASPGDTTASSRAMAFVMDDYGLTATNNTSRVRDALSKFVDSHADDATSMAVIRTSPPADAAPLFTSDKRLLHAAVEALGRPPKERMPLRPPPQMFALWHRKLLLQTLSAIAAAVDVLSRVPGRRSLVLFSDALDFEDKDPNFNNRPDPDVMDALARIEELANRGSVVVYTVPPVGLDQPKLWLTPFNGLHILPEATGGLLLKNANDLGWALDRVTRDQSGYYLLGYSPTQAFFQKKDGQPVFRKLEVRVKRRGLSVRSRKGCATAGYDRTPASDGACANSSIAFSLKAGMSSGLRLVTMFPSTTTS